MGIPGQSLLDLPFETTLLDIVWHVIMVGNCLFCPCFPSIVLLKVCRALLSLWGILLLDVRSLNVQSQHSDELIDIHWGLNFLFNSYFILRL